MFSGLMSLCDNSSDDEQLPPIKPKPPSPKCIRAPKQPKPKSIQKLSYESSCKGHICEYDEYDLDPTLFPTPNELLQAYIPRLPTIAPLGTGFTAPQTTPYTPTTNTTIQVKFQQSLFAVNQDWECDIDLPIETTLSYKNVSSTTTILPYYKRTFIRLPPHHSQYIIKCYEEYYKQPNLDYLMQLYFYVLQNVYNTKLVAMNKGVLATRLIQLTKQCEEESIIQFQRIWDDLKYKDENGSDNEDGNDNGHNENNINDLREAKNQNDEIIQSIHNDENNIDTTDQDEWSVVNSEDYDEDYEQNQDESTIIHNNEQTQTINTTTLTIANEEYFQHTTITQQQQHEDESLPQQSSPIQQQLHKKKPTTQPILPQFDINYDTNYHYKYPTIYNNNQSITDNGKLIQIYIGHKYPSLPHDISLTSSFPLSMIRQHEHLYYGIIEYPFREYALIQIPLSFLTPNFYTLYQQSLLFIYNIFKREIYHLLLEFRDIHMTVERIQDDLTSDYITRVKCKECLSICLHNQCYIEYHSSTPFKTLVEDFIIQYTNQNNIQNNNKNTSQLHEHRQQQQQQSFVQLQVPQIIYSSETNDGIQGYYLANDELSLQWVQYHTINAKLIPICGKCRTSRITMLKKNNSNGYFTYFPPEELF